MSAESSTPEIYTPAQDERSLACISHLAIFVSTIGLLIAIGLWLYLREKQPYAAFQAAQAMLFQFITMVLTFFVAIGVMAFVLGVFGAGMAVGAAPNEAAFGIFMAIVVVILVIFGVIVSLLLYGYAAYAGYQSWKGRPFRIPGIANIADAISPMPRMSETGGSQ